MILPQRVIILTCVAFSLSHAQQPIPSPANANSDEAVFDIPKIESVTIDGKGDDWSQKGFRVEVLAGGSGAVRDPKDFDPTFRLGWDERGLLVLVTVRCNQFTEADEPRLLWQKNGIEMFLGERRGSPQFFQVLAGTGGDPRFPKLRTLIVDLRKTASPQKLEVEAASTRTADGYILEARLPWSNLNIKPHAGEEVAFQLCVNNVSEAGSKISAGWYPWQETNVNPNAMARVRLATKASVPVRMAARASQEHDGARVDVVAPMSFSGKRIVAKMNGKMVATSTLESISGRTHTAFLLPAGDVEISNADSGSVRITGIAAKFSEATVRANFHADIAFKPCVFSEEKFPPCDLAQPAEMEKLLGKYTLIPTFYDAEYHEVKTAAKPGRYGAVVEVRTECGQTFQRFVTLYRMPKELKWRLAHIRLSSLELPPEFGLSPEVVNDRIKDIGYYFTSQMHEGISKEQDTAILFAGLAETKSGGEAPRWRNSAYALNQKWWYGWKKQMGKLRNDYYVHLPAGYENDPQKKWPLFLFLHGSGERGNDINQVKVFLTRVLKDKSDFPCIVLAPQCSPGEWWSPFELNDLLDRVEAQYRVDTDRVYLTGLSMGGYGSWALATESPQRFAAVVPICGRGDPDDVERIKDIPVWVFHGGKDDVVPIENSQEMVDALKKVGSNVKFTIFPEANHDSWTPAYAMAELYEWLLKQSRTVKPKTDIGGSESH